MSESSRIVQIRHSEFLIQKAEVAFRKTRRGEHRADGRREPLRRGHSAVNAGRIQRFRLLTRRLADPRRIPESKHG